MRKLLFLVAMLATTAILFSSCSKGSDSVQGPRKVQYKLIGSTNAIIHNVTYTNADGDITSSTGINNNTWTSEEFTIPASVKFIGLTAGGFTSDDLSGELRGQIIIDGKVVKDNKATGPTLAIVLNTAL